jgi:predicted RNA-binding protein with PUA-like domain
MAKSYWLFKSEAAVFSIDDLARSPRGTTTWDGIRNAEARNLMRDRIRAGDLAFFHHSSSQPTAIVGIVEVVGAGKPEPKDPKWFTVELKFVEKLARPVTLDEVKRDPRLAAMALVKKSRLSVQPVTPAEWKAVLELARRPATASRAARAARAK